MPHKGKKFQKAEQARRVASEGGSQKAANVAAAAVLVELPGALGGAGQEVRHSSNG